MEKNKTRRPKRVPPPSPETAQKYFLHEMLKWIDVMTSFLDRNEAKSLIQRTPHARTVRVSYPHACCPVYSATSLNSAKCQQRHQGFNRVRVQVQVLTNHLSTHPRPTLCHVLRCIHTNSDPFLHTFYCEYCLITCAARATTHVISHNDTSPEPQAINTVTMPFVFQTIQYWAGVNELPQI